MGQQAVVARYIAEYFQGECEDVSFHINLLRSSNRRGLDADTWAWGDSPMALMKKVNGWISMTSRDS